MRSGRRKCHPYGDVLIFPLGCVSSNVLGPVNIPILPGVLTFQVTHWLYQPQLVEHHDSGMDLESEIGLPPANNRIVFPNLSNFLSLAKSGW